MKFVISLLSIISFAFTANALTAAPLSEAEPSALGSSTFSSLDLNQDGVLTHDEAVSDTAIGSHFEGADRDHDGELNRAEYRSLQAAAQKNQLDLLPDDYTVTAAVQAQLTQGLNAKQINIHVDTYKGEVFLTGYVDTELQLRKAAEITRKVAGVASVKSGLIARG